MILTYRYRVKNPTKILDRQSSAVNLVWNFCNESQKSCLRLGKRWLSGFDLIYLTIGTSKELRLHSGTIAAACQQYAANRRQKKRPFLRWRGKKSLGWIPFKGRDIRIVGDTLVFARRKFRLFFSREIPPLARVCDGGSFSEDACGRWYVNIVVELPEPPTRTVRSAVGIDLGLNTLVALSTGEKVDNPRHLARYAERLARAQRARKKRQAAGLHAQVVNARRDFHHKLSTRLVHEFDKIVVGNVNARGLARTRMAKSVLDAGWSSFRQMLAYKAIAHGATYTEVNEAYSTQVCSRCGCLPDGRPRGIADLGIRTWTCGDCGAVHDRDMNAARNILFGSGHRTPAEGILALWGGEDVNFRCVQCG